MMNIIFSFSPQILSEFFNESQNYAILTDTRIENKSKGVGDAREKNTIGFKLLAENCECVSCDWRGIYRAI